MLDGSSFAAAARVMYLSFGVLLVGARVRNINGIGSGASHAGAGMEVVSASVIGARVRLFPGRATIRAGGVLLAIARSWRDVHRSQQAMQMQDTSSTRRE